MGTVDDRFKALLISGKIRRLSCERQMNDLFGQGSAACGDDQSYQTTQSEPLGIPRPFCSWHLAGAARNAAPALSRSHQALTYELSLSVGLIPFPFDQ